MPAEAVEATLRRAWEILAELDVPAALMGGLALANWGRIRSTQDVDLLVALTDVRSPKLLASLSGAGFRAKRRDPLIRLEDAEFIQLFYEPPETFLEIQIDLLLADKPFHRQAVERRIPLPTSALGFAVDVVSCEDLIVLKLIAWRILDRVDAAELMKLNRDTLDLAYISNWILALELEQPFREAWGDAFPGIQPPF
jgi:hypothetical protein